MGRGRQQGTGVRIRSEAKAHATDRLLLAAQDEAERYDAVKAHHDQTPRWRFRQRRALERLCLVHASRHLQAIRAAQDIARKGRHVEL